MSRELPDPVPRLTVITLGVRDIRTSIASTAIPGRSSSRPASRSATTGGCIWRSKAV